jgi:hypothetical protein
MGEDLIAISECPPGHEFWQWFFELRCKLAEAEERDLPEQERMIATIGAVRDFAKRVASVPEFSREFSFLQGQTTQLCAAFSELPRGKDSRLFAKAEVGNKQRSAIDQIKIATAAAIVDVAGRRGLDQKRAAQVISDVLRDSGFAMEGNRPLTRNTVLEWPKECRRARAKGDMPGLFRQYVEQLDRDDFPLSDGALADFIKKAFRP